MQSVIIDTSTQYSIVGSADPLSAQIVTFKTVGLTGTCSVIPKVRKAGAGTSNLVSVPYFNVNTDADVAADTAIAADGVYRIAATGPEIILDATVSSGTATISYWIISGAAGAGGGSGGGGGAVTGHVAINDGVTTTRLGTVKAASTPAAATDTAVVVDQRPGTTVTTTGTDADNAPNSTTKLPTIPARANAAAQSWTEGHEVPLSTDLSGALRVNLVADSTTASGSKSTVAQVTVASTAGGTLIIAANTARKSVTIINSGSATIYLGNSGLTTSNGFPLAAGASVSDVTTTDAWYGIVASTSVVAGVIEVS